MKLRIAFFFLVLLLVLNFLLDLKDINNSWTFFFKNFLWVPFMFSLFFLFNKKRRFLKTIFYCWVTYVILFGIDLVFYSPQPTILREFMFMTLGAISTYLLSKYYLKVETAPSPTKGFNN